MNIATLEDYVEMLNGRRGIFDAKPLSLLNSEDRQSIADSLSGALSPENLTMDGELPRNLVDVRYRMLSRAAQELLSIDPNVVIEEY